MKKVGIDARLYFQTGVGVYIRNLIHYLDQKEEEGIVFYIYLLEQDFNKVKFKNKNFIKKKADYLWHSFGEQFGFLDLLNKDNLDLMHFTYFSFPIRYKRKYLATVHDMTPVYFKTGKVSTKNRLLYEFKHLVFKHVLKTQVKNATKIITPTKTVKEQLTNYYGSYLQDKIDFIYEGINYEFLEALENINLKNKFPGKFFIYVGNFYPHKNVDSLVKAFSQIKYKDYKLILIGPKDFFVSRLLAQTDKLNHKKNVIFYHNQSLNDLVFFYKNAQALIHPSISEGFGLPIVEALNYNLPIIASNIAVFQEILQNRYLSFSPKNPDDIQAKIEQFIQKKPNYDYHNLTNKFSFAKMTEKTLEYYRRI